ncbi:sn-glycerol-3-phosphate ABC transporter ATP-binding protein UgpC [Mesorhizobium sp. LHD-90]|uniref:ABC transporter ATP-binding protein n=1 Tax=Mesorhizobium sp. LHD-90 TaxID=3071414 RepID=UPI0027E1F85D|nr:sn-glycerol-3-phosphate ABC transporter ATP-binding protein UgpC [Mesorhizobium sp. LHD-90]MDQ6433231.1 sn-glycerol-3-phosphate ABC transporter ATP-binding protein UgpC [Mesorhizobium sp. LHD-90]
MGSITLRDLSKTYGGGTVAAVRSVDLDIEDGEFVVFVGPSGCGKSTLLRMIAGLEKISGGTVAINGKVVNEVASRNRDIAMVFQNYALYPTMTVRQNIAFALELRKFPQAAIDERVNEAARILDLKDLLDRKPGQLSGGQRQRVAMGRAIVRHPQAFLLDEPLSNLDAKLRVQLRAELGRLHQRLGVTTIHVTHDQVEAMTLGNRVAVFSRGTLQQYDTPKNLYEAPKNLFVAGFIGSPAMNFLEGALAGDGAFVRIGAAEIGLGTRAKAGQSERVLAGIRPEHLSWRPRAEAAAGALPGTVDFVESIEPEAYVTIVLDDPSIRVRQAEEAAANGSAGNGASPDGGVQRIQMRVSSRAAPALGQKIALTADPDRIRLFDAVSGAAL